jgi:hypothetical protein
LLAVLVPSRAATSGTSVAGICEYKVPAGNGTFYRERCRFVVSTAGCSWIISYEDVPNPNGQGLLTPPATGSCDGTNIYFVELQTEARAKAAWGERYESVKPGLPAALATIYPGNYPPPEQHMLQKLWFAFASSCVLRPPAGRAKPMSSVDLAVFYDNTNFSIGYYLTADTEHPGDRTITLTNDGCIVERDRASGKVLRLRGAPPYDKGFTEAVGTWSHTTNVSGMSVPTEFQYTSFVPKYSPGQSTPDVREWMTYRCVVTNVQSATIEAVPAPLPAGRVLVTDRRLMRQGWSQLSYLATNDWVAGNDPRVTFRAKNSRKSALEAEVLGAMGIKPGGSDQLRHLIWVLLALPLGILGLKGLLNKLRQRHKKGMT